MLFEIQQYPRGQKLSDEDLSSLQELINQLIWPVSYVPDRDTVQMTVDDPNNVVLMVRDSLTSSVIATATLIVRHQMVGVLGQVEDVVVSKNYRGQGLGKEIMNEIIRTARSIHGMKELHLTSHPLRVAANRLYTNLGFTKYNTNKYRLDL